jgi:hypothetical protein
VKSKGCRTYTRTVRRSYSSELKTLLEARHAYLADNDVLLDTDNVAVVVIDADKEVDDVTVFDVDDDHDVDDVAVLVVDAVGDGERDKVADDDGVRDGDADWETLIVRVDDSEADGVSDGVEDEFTWQYDASDCGSRIQLGGWHEAEHASTVMQLNDMSKVPVLVVVHVQEPVKRLCEALKYLARKKYNAVQTNTVNIAAGTATQRATAAH